MCLYYFIFFQRYFLIIIVEKRLTLYSQFSTSTHTLQASVFYNIFNLAEIHTSGTKHSILLKIKEKRFDYSDF